MADTTSTPVRIDRAQWTALAAIKERDGIAIAEQVRRALAAWIATRQPRQPAKGKRS